MSKKSQENAGSLAPTATTTEMEIIGGSTGLQASMPAYLQETDDRTGIDELRKFVKPPFVKCVQKSASTDLLTEYPFGTILLVPDMIELIASPKKNEDQASLFITPVFYYTEYFVQNPFGSNLPFIQERSLDTDSDIAKRSRDAKTRKNEDGSKNVESMNFICVIHGPVKLNKFVMISFSKGSHKRGRALAALITARQRAIYTGIYKLTPFMDENADGQEYFVLKPSNPGPDDDFGPWVEDQGVAAGLKNIHIQMQEALKTGNLQADYEAANTADGENPDEDNTVEAGSGQKQEF